MKAIDNIKRHIVKVAGDMGYYGLIWVDLVVTADQGKGYTIDARWLSGNGEIVEYTTQLADDTASKRKAAHMQNKRVYLG